MTDNQTDYSKKVLQARKDEFAADINFLAQKCIADTCAKLNVVQSKIATDSKIQNNVEKNLDLVATHSQHADDVKNLLKKELHSQYINDLTQNHSLISNEKESVDIVDQWQQKEILSHPDKKDHVLLPTEVWVGKQNKANSKSY